jgi:hypothetical protein
MSKIMLLMPGIGLYHIKTVNPICLKKQIGFLPPLQIADKDFTNWHQDCATD